MPRTYGDVSLHDRLPPLGPPLHRTDMNSRPSSRSCRPVTSSWRCLRPGARCGSANLPNSDAAIWTCAPTASSPPWRRPRRWKAHRRPTEDRCRHSRRRAPPHLVPIVKGHLADFTAPAGATLAELMGRLCHSTPGAAMRYQHAAADHDAEIARRLSELANGSRTVSSEGVGPQ